MKRSKIVIFLLSVAAGLVPTVAYAQEPVAPGGIDPDSLAAGFGNINFWIALFAAMIAGALGGVVYELLILQGNIEFPHRLTADEVQEEFPYATAKNLFDLGIWARVIIGALAAVAALLVLAPSTTFDLLATAIIAGSAGTSVFRSMQDRLSAALAQTAAADVRDTASRQAAKVDEAMQAFAGAKETLLREATSPAGVRDLVFKSEAKLDIGGEFDRVERLLSEAKGMSQGM